MSIAEPPLVKWREVRVGLLVIAGFLLFAVAVFFVGGTPGGFFTETYEIDVLFGAANGLRPGGEVWMEGVSIGTVRKVDLSRGFPKKEHSVTVTLRLDRRYHDLIRSDSIVTIGVMGLLGDKYVDISRGTAAGAVLQNGDALIGQAIYLKIDSKAIEESFREFGRALGEAADQVQRDEQSEK